MNICLPFEGFYGTLAGGSVEYAVERVLEDDFSEDSVTPEQVDNAEIDWRGIRNEYARSFTYCLLMELGEPFGLDYESCKALSDSVQIHSPREYNFENDSLWLDIPDDAALKIMDYGYEHYMPELQVFWKSSTTAISGYIPFYSYAEFEEAFDHRELGDTLNDFSVGEIIRLCFTTYWGGLWDLCIDGRVMESLSVADYIKYPESETEDE